MIGNELNYSIRMKTNNNNSTLLNYIHLRLAGWLTDWLSCWAGWLLICSCTPRKKILKVIVDIHKWLIFNGFFLSSSHLILLWLFTFCIWIDLQELEASLWLISVHGHASNYHKKFNWKYIQDEWKWTWSGGMYADADIYDCWKLMLRWCCNWENSVSHQHARIDGTLLAMFGRLTLANA